MKFLPIVERELRVAARRGGTYWVRTWVATIVIIGCTAILMLNTDEPPNKVASLLFYPTTVGALLYSLLIGAWATSDSLSEEKREGTLGLLFLTDLKGFDVVIGKLVANSLNCFYGLLAIIPMAAVPLLMGGLTATEVACAALALVNAMFFSLCTGMLASALCRSAWKAALLTLLIVATISAVLPIVSLVQLDRTGAGIPRYDLTFLCSPIFSFVAPYDFGRVWVKDMSTFATSVAIVHAECWIFLLIASLIVPRSWQDKAAGVRQLRWRERWKLWSYGNLEERKRFRGRLLDVNPFFWLAARGRLKPMWVWLLLGLTACFWAWGYGEYQHDWFNEVTYIMTAFALNSIFKNWVATEAVRQLSEERRAGSLELLLATPMEIKEILRGQSLALLRQFAWPLCIIITAEFVMMLSGMRQSYNQDERGGWMLFWMLWIVSLVTDLIAIYWVGMWTGLTSRSSRRAYTETVGRVLALPWVIFVSFLFFYFLASMGRGSGSWQMVMLFWFGTGFAVDFGFGMWAQQKLKTEFREAATRRFTRKVSIWKQVFGSAKENAME